MVDSSTLRVVTISVFTVLFLCYVLQLVIAVHLKKQPEPLSTGGGDRFTDHQIMRVYDGGLRNNFWVFGVLAIFLPVVLAFVTSLLIVERYSGADLLDYLSPIVQALDPEAPVSPDQWTGLYTLLSDPPDVGPRSIEYVELCLSVIVVLITLELSQIHSLRDVSSQWTSMLIVASALDFATLLTIVYTVCTSDVYYVRFFMLLATAVAFLSTFYILAYARVSGARKSGKLKPRQLRALLEQRKHDSGEDPNPAVPPDKEE